MLNICAVCTCTACHKNNKSVSCNQSKAEQNVFCSNEKVCRAAALDRSAEAKTTKIIKKKNVVRDSVWQKACTRITQHASHTRSTEVVRSDHGNIAGWAPPEDSRMWHMFQKRRPQTRPALRILATTGDPFSHTLALVQPRRGTSLEVGVRRYIVVVREAVVGGRERQPVQRDVIPERNEPVKPSVQGGTSTESGTGVANHRLGSVF